MLKQTTLFVGLVLGLLATPMTTVGLHATDEDLTLSPGSYPIIPGECQYGLIRPAQEEENSYSYYANLSGTSEVPTPVSTEATGCAIFNFSLAHLNYDVNTKNLKNVTAAHIYQGNERENGQIVLTLYDAAEQQRGDVHRLMIYQYEAETVPGYWGGADTAYAAEFEGPLAGQDLTKLINLINQGEAYVNFHTVDFPNGEIRGKIVCCFEQMPPGFPLD